MPTHEASIAPSGLCQCGCGTAALVASRTVTAWGWKKGTPIRFIKGHNHRKPRVQRPCGCGCGEMVDGQFVDGHMPRTLRAGYVVDENGCWNYAGYVRGDGRAGTVFHRGRAVQAYRAFYEDAKGPVPEGLVLDHLCGNPRCVNPDHLEPVTQAENVRRERVVKLSTGTAAEIRSAVALGETRAAIARRLGVSRSLVSLVAGGKRWA